MVVVVPETSETNSVPLFDALHLLVLRLTSKLTVIYNFNKSAADIYIHMYVEGFF